MRCIIFLPLGALLYDIVLFYLNSNSIICPLKEFENVFDLFEFYVKLTCREFVDHRAEFSSDMTPGGFLEHSGVAITKNLSLLLLFSASYKQFMTFDGEISSAYRFTANITLLGEMNNKWFSLKLLCKYWLLCTIAALQLL